MTEADSSIGNGLMHKIMPHTQHCFHIAACL